MNKSNTDRFNELILKLDSRQKETMFEGINQILICYLDNIGDNDIQIIVKRSGDKSVSASMKIFK